MNGLRPHIASRKVDMAIERDSGGHFGQIFSKLHPYTLMVNPTHEEHVGHWYLLDQEKLDRISGDEEERENLFLGV